MKKRILVFVLLLALCSPLMFAKWAVGAEASFGGPFTGTASGSGAFVFQLPSLPIMFATSLSLANNGPMHFGLTADWHLLNGALVNFINYYVGPGLYLGINTGNSPAFNIGARLPLALYILPLNWLELFLEFAPTLEAFNSQGFSFPNFGWQAAVGVRFWF